MVIVRPERVTTTWLALPAAALYCTVVPAAEATPAAAACAGAAAVPTTATVVKIPRPTLVSRVLRLMGILPRRFQLGRLDAQLTTASSGVVKRLSPVVLGYAPPSMRRCHRQN